MKNPASMTLDTRSLSSCFNVHNIEHLKAYDHLQKTGQWPKNMSAIFPNDMFITALCVSLIRDRLADTWVEYKIQNESSPVEIKK